MIRSSLRFCLLSIGLLATGCAGPTIVQSSALPGASITTSETWRAVDGKDSEQTHLFTLQDTSRQMAGRVRLLPDFEQREALLVWLMLDLQEVGISSLDGPNPLEPASLLSDDASDALWLAKDPAQPEFYREYLIHHEAGGASLLFEMVGPKDALDASREQRLALYRTLELPASTTETQTKESRDCVAAQGDGAEHGTVTAITCDERLLVANHHVVDMPYPTTREDLVEQFTERTQGSTSLVGEIAVATREDGSIILEKHERSPMPLVEITHLHRWRVVGAQVTMTTISLPTLMLDQTPAELVEFIEQIAAQTEDESP